MKVRVILRDCKSPEEFFRAARELEKKAEEYRTLAKILRPARRGQKVNKKK